MARTYDSQRLRHQRRMEQRLTADHRLLARNIAGLVLRAATARDESGTPIVPNSRAVRQRLNDAIWEQVLKPYYIGSGTDALRGAEPQSPYARLLVEGITEATRIQVQRQVAIVRRVVHDETVLQWLTGPRPFMAREMVPTFAGRITELVGPTAAQTGALRGVDGRIDVERARGVLVQPRGMYEPFHAWVDPNGYRLSDRIWRTSIDVRSRIDRMMEYHISRGTSAVQVADLIEPFLTPGALQQRTQRPYGTEGSYAARRLARTEITAAAGRATVNASAANPFVNQMQWRLSGSHPRIDICDTYARGGPNGDGIYPLGEVPPYPPHPHCLCSLLPVPAGDPAELVASLREDIQAARGNLLDAVGRGNAGRARALQGILNPEYMQRAILSGNLDEAVASAVRQSRNAGRLPVNVRARVPRVTTPRIDYASARIEDMGTVEDVQKWAAARYPKITFDFTETHINALKPTVQQFDKLARKYPEVAARLEYVGTYRGTGAPSRDFGKTTMAHATSDGKIIGLNPDYYNHPNLLAETLRDCFESKWLDADGTIESLLSHEFGHQVENWLLSTSKSFLPYARADGFGIVNETVNMFNKKYKPTTGLSKYAITTNSVKTAARASSAANRAEGWAEAFAAIQHKPRSQWPAYVKRVDGLLTEIAEPSRWTSPRFTDELRKLAEDVREAELRRIDQVRERLGL